MIFFSFSIWHNDSYAFREYPRLTEYQRIHQPIIPDLSGALRPGQNRCPVCGELLDKWHEPLTGLRLRKRKLDISCTYDGVTVASERFKQAYEEAQLSGLEFRQLPDDPEFFAIQAVRSVPFDAERRKTRFENKCLECGRFESVVGAHPVCLQPGAKIEPNEFVRTDLEFATGDEKHPLLLCGVEAAAALEQSKLKKLDLVREDQ